MTSNTFLHDQMEDLKDKVKKFCLYEMDIVTPNLP